jgi:small subunit ribosomal protein S13
MPVARIAGITLPNKRAEIALTYIRGIGRTRSKKILEQLNIDPNIRMNDMDAATVNKLREVIEKSYRVEGELRRDIAASIKRLKEIGCYRGLRHIRGLTCRGQRTKTNSRTVRGNVRRTMGSGKTKIEKK